MASGERITNVIPPESLIAGFNPACYTQLDERDLPFKQFENLQSCEVQRCCARLIQFLYDGRLDRFNDLLYTMIPNTYVINHVDREFPYGRTAIVANSRWSLIFAEGTTDFQQFAYQAFTAMREPDDFGMISTNPLWWSYATTISTRAIAAGTTPGTPVFLCGHSYGGAAVSLAGIRFRIWSPNRKINLLTFGMPKIGDERAVTQIAGINSLHICNTTDIANVIPPSALDLAPFLGVLGPLAPSVFTRWRAANNRRRLFADGTMDANDVEFPGYDTFLPILTQVLTGESLDPFVGHTIGEYYRRLTIRCPGVKWPVIPDTIYEETKPYDAPIYAEGGDEDGGHAWMILNPYYFAMGGDADGGHAKATFDWALKGLGGDVDGGHAETEYPPQYRGHGGDDDGGSAVMGILGGSCATAIPLKVGQVVVWDLPGTQLFWYAIEDTVPGTFYRASMPVSTGAVLLRLRVGVCPLPATVGELFDGARCLDGYEGVDLPLRYFFECFKDESSGNDVEFSLSVGDCP